MDGFCLVETEHQEVMGGFSSILGVMAVFCLVDPQLFIETHNFVADPQIFIGDPNKFYIKLVVSNYNLGLSIENSGSLMKIWESPMKIWGSPNKTCPSQRKSVVSNEFIWVSIENLGVCNKNLGSQRNAGGRQ